MPCVGKYLRLGHAYKDLQKAATKKIAEEAQYDSDVEEHKSAKLNAPIKKGSAALPAKTIKLSIDEAHDFEKFANEFKLLRTTVTADVPHMDILLDKIQEKIDKNKVTDAVADLNNLLKPYVNGPVGDKQVALVKRIRYLRDELRT